MHGNFDLRRVNVHDDRRRIGDEFDPNPPAAQRTRFCLMAGERDRAVDDGVQRGRLKIKNARLRATEHGHDNGVNPPDFAPHAFE